MSNCHPYYPLRNLPNEGDSEHAKKLKNEVNGIPACAKRAEPVLVSTRRKFFAYCRP